MANDDVNLKLGIDMTSLQRDAAQAVNMIQQAFAGGNFGGQLLGSGLAPNSISTPAGAQAGGVRGIIDALVRVERVLVAGFAALSGIGMHGSGGGGSGVGSGPPPALPSPRMPKQPASGVGEWLGLGKGGGAGAMFAPGALAGGVASRLFKYGVDSTTVLQSMSDVVGGIPGVGGALNSMFVNPIKDSSDLMDNYREQLGRMYRVSGDRGVKFMRNTMETDQGRDLMDQQVLTPTQIEDLYGASAAQATGGDSSLLNIGTRAAGAMGMGAGHRAISFGASMQRGGVGNADEAFFAAIGSAVERGLGRSRWLEVADRMKSVADSLGSTVFDWQGAIQQQEDIARLGQRFAGGGPAAQALEGVERSMLTSQQGLTGAVGFKAAVETLRQRGQGAGYFAVRGLMERGFNDKAYRANFIKGMLGTGLGQAWVQSRATMGGKGDESLLTNFAGLLQQSMPDQKIDDIKNTILEMSGSEGVDVGARAAKGGESLTAPGSKLMPTTRREIYGSRVFPSNDEPATGTYGDYYAPDAIRDMARGLKTTQDQMRRATGSGAFGFTPPAHGRIGQLSEDEIAKMARDAGLPVQFMRSWISGENAGTPGTEGNLGFAEISPSEAHEVLGLQGEDLGRLKTDKAFDMQQSAKFARIYRDRAKRMMPKWSDEDILHLTKYQHGGSGFMKDAFSQFKTQMGRDPENWQEFYNRMEPQLTGSPGVGAKGAIQNANKIQVDVTYHSEPRPSVTVRGAGPTMVGGAASLYAPRGPLR